MNQQNLGILIFVFLFFLSQSLSADDRDFDVEAFGRLPVQKDGRVKPIDTIARNVLLVLRGKQSVLEKGEKIPATKWFLDLVFNPARADQYKVFRVDHPEVLAIFDYRPGEEKYFSFNELFKRDKLLDIDSQLEVLTNRFLENRTKSSSLDEKSPEFQAIENDNAGIREQFGALQAKQKVLRENIALIDNYFKRIKFGEDINGNGQMDEGEDLNENGVLDPGPNPKKYTTYQNQAIKLYGALSLYDQLKSGLFMSLQLPIFGSRYSTFLKSSSKLDSAIHQVEAQGEGPLAQETIQHATLLAREELNQFGADLSRHQYDQIILKYRIAIQAAKNNSSFDGDQLNDVQVNEIFKSINEYADLYEEFEYAKSLAARNARFSVLGIIPPMVTKGTADLLTGDDIVKGNETAFTKDYKVGDQFRVGQQGPWDGLWRDAAVRDKMVEEIMSDTEMRLNYVHEGRPVYINAVFYLCVLGISALLFRRLEGVSPSRRVGTPFVFAICLVVPWLFCFGPSHVDRSNVHLHATDWQNLGENLNAAAHSAHLHPVVAQYADLADTFTRNDSTSFNNTVQEMTAQFAKLTPKMEYDLRSINFEYSFNEMQPFYRAMTLYVLVFLLVLLSWLWKPELLTRIAFWLMTGCLILHTAGLVSRIWIQARPPVTNLYSSAIFIGWGAVVLGLLFERLYKNGIGAAAGSVVGFVTLIIAHHLGMGGDTMEMMQAVLDTNIWLATHVVVITLGYTAMFLAGILGVVFLIRGLVDRSFEKETAKSMSSMVYGITCFAVLFSFVGTMLGGIWADQSWGRFWGWDPKENGALLIVIWSAIVLHARWGGLVRDRGIMILSIFGNIVTAWSWFGTNLLQEGLHSYGFSEAGFRWLMIFVASQIFLMLIGALPISVWNSPWAKSSMPQSPTSA